MDATLVVAIVAAALTGGGIGAGLTHVRERRKVEHESLGLFYETWHRETLRLHNEIDELRDLVVALSDEVIELGGDPLRIRTCLHRAQQRDEPEQANNAMGAPVNGPG